MPRPSVIENRKMLYYNKILKSERIDEQRTGWVFLKSVTFVTST